VISLADLTAAHFRPLAGETFELELRPGAPVPATLLEVEEHTRYAWPGSPRTPFSIRFRLPPGVLAAQGTYPLAHPALGRIEVFFTAPGADLLDASFS
jgi:hypothetical protein